MDPAFLCMYSGTVFRQLLFRLQFWFHNPRSFFQLLILYHPVQARRNSILGGVPLLSPSMQKFDQCVKRTTVQLVFRWHLVQQSEFADELFWWEEYLVNWMKFLTCKQYWVGHLSFLLKLTFLTNTISLMISKFSAFPCFCFTDYR